jgi:hypothetical protein
MHCASYELVSYKIKVTTLGLRGMGGISDLKLWNNLRGEVGRNNRGGVGPKGSE